MPADRALWISIIDSRQDIRHKCSLTPVNLLKSIASETATDSAAEGIPGNPSLFEILPS